MQNQSSLSTPRKISPYECPTVGDDADLAQIERDKMLRDNLRQGIKQIVRNGQKELNNYLRQQSSNPNSPLTHNHPSSFTQSATKVVPPVQDRRLYDLYVRLQRLE